LNSELVKTKINLILPFILYYWHEPKGVLHAAVVVVVVVVAVVAAERRVNIFVFGKSFPKKKK